MAFNQTEKQEKEYLQQVITTIHDTINTTSNFAHRFDSIFIL